jgi:hypothetical protein
MSEENDFSYYADEETELVIIPMKGGVNMAFVLGSTENLEAKIAKAVTEKVQVTIPKMDLETDFSSGELVAFLKEYGKPVVWTLHDCWSFTGFCSHYMYHGCDLWQSGCHTCKYRDVYPYRVLSHSAKNYAVKQECYQNQKLQLYPKRHQ